jgi:DNA-binding transcriptional MerR regulator
MPNKLATEWTSLKKTNLGAVKSDRRASVNSLDTILSPRELIEIAGITAETLSTWYKRKLLPPEDFPDIAPGHGRRRKYSVAQAIVLRIMRTLIDVGVSVEVAKTFASQHSRRLEVRLTAKLRPNHFLLFDAVSELLKICHALPADEAGEVLKEEPYPLAVLFKIIPTDEGEAMPARGQDVDGFMLETHKCAADIPRIMRNKSGSQAVIVVIDAALLAARISDRISRVNAARQKARAGRSIP